MRHSPKKSARDAFFLIIGAVVIIWSFYIFLQKPASPRFQQELLISKIRDSKLSIGGKQLNIELADTAEERSLGLSGRESLPSGSGLLFIFDKPGNYGFWMYDMRFLIDIVWLDENLEVIDMEKNVGPDSFPHIFYPPRPVKYVLEVNTGELD